MRRARGTENMYKMALWPISPIPPPPPTEVLRTRPSQIYPSTGLIHVPYIQPYHIIHELEIRIVSAGVCSAVLNQ